MVLSLAEPFGALFRLRRRYFFSQSRALYARYAHVLILCLALFGLLLVERPGLLAAPILHFWRDPANWQAGLAYGAGWLLLIALWARVHRPFVRGAALADYARASPAGARVAPALDLAMLLVALQWWALPFAIAIWTVAASAARPPGADGWFPLYAVVMFLVTIAAAHAVVLSDGPPRRPRRAGATGVLRGPALGWLALLQLRALWHAHLHVALPRIGVALLVQAASWVMIFQVGKERDAAGFIALACCLAAYALSGLYNAFWRARQRLAPYLRSMPLGTVKVLMAEHLVVLGVGSLVCALVWFGYWLAPGAGADLLATLARCMGVSLVLLAGLGAPILQRHPYGAGCKVALSVAALFLMEAVQ